MDHELKQRLIGAVVVTALCAIFIPMLFDDPIDNSGQIVSELSIPEPANSGEDIAGKLPASADEVLTQPDAESLSTETTGEILESTGAEEEDTQAGEEASVTEVVEEVKKPVKAAKPAEKVPAKTTAPKPVSTQKPVAADVAEEVQKPAKAAKSEDIEQKATPPKPVSAQKPVDAAVAEEVKKSVKAAKPELAQPKEAAPKQASAPKPVEADVAEEVKKPVKVTKPENIQPKPVSAEKPVDVAVEEAKKPVVVPKAEPPKLPEMVRWYIQVGSFSQKENAQALWDKLHQQGFPVSLDTIPSEKGPTIYRLRIGPELDGKRAAAMKLKLDKQNVKAILISE